MNILMYVDASERSKKAIKFVSNIIKNLEDNKLYLIHVLPGIPEFYFGWKLDKERDRKYIEKIKAQQEKAYNKVVNTIQEVLNRIGIKAEKFIVKEGHKGEEILKEANKGYDFLVISSKDDISKFIVTNSNIPVLIFKGSTKLKKVLFCTDGSEHAENAIKFGGELIKNLKVKATVLCVSSSALILKKLRAMGLSEEMIKDLANKMKEFPKPEKKYLEKGRKILKNMGIDAKTKLLDGDPAVEILKEAKNYDLVVIGCTGVGGVKEFFIGSTTMEMIKSHKNSILVVK